VIPAARRHRILVACVVLALALVAATLRSEQSSAALVRAPRMLPASTTDRHWLATWGAAPQAATTANPLSERGFDHETLRQIVFASAGGDEVRVHFTNAYGLAPLEIGRASIAIEGSDDGADLAGGTSRQLLFDGRQSVTIPAGEEAVSDPVALDVPPLSRLAISLYVPDATGPATEHVESHESGFVAEGSHILDAGGGPFSESIGSWFFIDGVDVMAPDTDLGTVVALGDSITAGVGSSLNGDANWPDDLAKRLQALAGPTLAVVDEGIGGNRILNPSPCCGVSAIDRFSTDVADQTGARDVILLEGVNDLGYSQKHTVTTLPHTDVSAAQVIAGDERIIAMAHAAGLRIFGATILPFQGARYWTPAAELKRDAINHWILTSGAFDGVIDFSAIMADPTDPLRLNPAYDSGDHLHPNDAGYSAMAAAIPLPMLLGSPASGAKAGSGRTRSAVDAVPSPGPRPARRGYTR
jgi:lysophospholipase L1-like esterase